MNVVVKRTDTADWTKGWGMNLKIECCKDGKYLTIAWIDLYRIDIMSSNLEIEAEHHHLELVTIFLQLFIEEAEKEDDPAEVNYGVQPAAVANEMEILRNFMTLEEKERILIGHDFNSFIKGCTFRGKNCLVEK